MSLTREAVMWSALMLWCGVVSAAVVMFTNVPVWVAAIVLAGWLGIFIRYWPHADEEQNHD